MFVPMKMTPAGVKRTWEKYGAYFEFILDVKRLIRRHERITYKIGRSGVSLLFNQIYIYICVCVCVCVCACAWVRAFVWVCMCVYAFFWILQNSWWFWFLIHIWLYWTLKHFLHFVASKFFFFFFQCIFHSFPIISCDISSTQKHLLPFTKTVVEFILQLRASARSFDYKISLLFIDVWFCLSSFIWLFLSMESFF